MAVEPRQPEDRRRLKAFALACAEALLALGAVLVSFLFFMGILSLSFPEGSGLHNLLERPGELTNPRESHIDIRAPEDLGAPSFVAVLDDVQHKVKEKREDSVSWEPAHGGQPLGERHSVQTYEGSRATIAFDEGSRLVLGENSLVIVRRLEERRDVRQKRAAVVLLGGAVEGTLGPADGGQMELEVVTGAATSRIRRSGGRETEFRMVADGDRAATLQVFGGAAEFEAGGRKVQLSADSWVRLSADGTVTGPLALPGVPTLEAPASAARYTFREQPPEVRFAWDPVPGAESYDFEVARDAEFRDRVLERRVAEAELRHDNLAAGRYFWRVSGVQGGARGRPGLARTFELECDRDAPALVVEFPTGPVSEPTFVVRGSAEPGSQVYVAGRKTTLSEAGTFEERIDLAPGTSVLVVEAYDAAGNVTTRSSSVHARF